MKHYLYALTSLLALFFLFLFGFNWLNNSIIFTLSNFNQALTNYIQNASQGTGWLLAGVSFIYGILHSIGPGHGKFVLSSYSIANNPQFRRLVALGLTISLLQGVTAVIIGWLALSIFSSSVSQFLQISNNLVLVSGIMIALLAFFWLSRAVLRLVKIYRLGQEFEQAAQVTNNFASSSASHSHSHLHHHTCKCGCTHDTEEASHPHHKCGHDVVTSKTEQPQDTLVTSDTVEHTHNHEHDHHHTHHTPHEHGPDCGCGNHLDWDKFNELDNLRDRLIMATSIILRPCTGAIFVLIFAYSIDLWWWGVASAMFMALGTGIGLIFTVKIVTWIKVMGFDRFKGKPSRKRAIFTQLALASLALALLLVAISTIQVGLKGEDGNRLYTRSSDMPSLELLEDSSSGTLGGSDESQSEPLPLDDQEQFPSDSDSEQPADSDQPDSQNSNPDSKQDTEDSSDSPSNSSDSPGNPLVPKR